MPEMAPKVSRKEVSIKPSFLNFKRLYIDLFKCFSKTHISLSFLHEFIKKTCDEPS